MNEKINLTRSYLLTKLFPMFEIFFSFQCIACSVMVSSLPDLRLNSKKKK